MGAGATLTHPGPLPGIGCALRSISCSVVAWVCSTDVLFVEFQVREKIYQEGENFSNEATTFGTPGCRVLVVLPPAHGEEHSDQADQLV